MEIQISVRNLVEFLLRSGDIDNRKSGGADNAMLEGARLHRLLQSRMGAGYLPEVSLRYLYDTEKYRIVVEGRADGIFTDESGVTVIDEIKTTYKDIAKLKGPNGVHLAQAKVYAAIYGMKEKQEEMRVRMTYCNVETEEIRYFFEDYTIQELQDWFLELLCEYRIWADYEYEWKQIRQDSLEKLEFPYTYREGQKELAAQVYRTIYHKKKLFIEAPTGVGKTLSTVFPALKAMGKGMGDKIFYLTAKTITRTVAENTYSLLRDRGLAFKSVILTAKEKICFQEETECNPDACPYAKGHYDRINAAVYDLLTHETSFTREVIEQYARKHKVCPFEFCLDMSLFADGIICDYNYAFDPHVYLRRFFAENNNGNYIFLVDEAHNLLDRGREMYSAELIKEDFLTLKKKIVAAEAGLLVPVSSMPSGAFGRIRDFARKLERDLERCNKELLILKKDCEKCEVLSGIDPFIQVLTRLFDTMNKYLEETDDNPVRADILDFYFQISHFLGIYELLDDNYVIYSEMMETSPYDGMFRLKLFCVNPAKALGECMERARSTILFSATFLPIQYYKNLLGGTKEDYEVYAKSIFDPEKRAIYIGRDVTSKYSRRNKTEYMNIARYLYEIIKNRHGNYMVFFPSRAFMMEVYDCFVKYFLEEEDSEIECILQEEFMNEEEREQFLQRFSAKTGDSQPVDFSGIMMDVEVEEEENPGNAAFPAELSAETDKILLGFCVMGGIFSEGIDLKHDSLIGVIVVGTGIPQVCNERELLKAYFDEREENGFDYAYRFPGMNKVLQAAGRVIRTEEDVGIIVLLDERFRQISYRRLFPREWTSYEEVTKDSISERIERFWDEWL